MLKYSFVVHHTNVTPFLEGLQTLGIADTRRSTKPADDAAAQLIDQITRYTSVCKKLDNISVDDIAAVPQEQPAAHVLQHTEALLAEQEQLAEHRRKLLQDITAARPWGHWERTSMQQLKDLGFVPHFYTASEKLYKPAWEEAYPVKILNSDSGRIYFAVLESAGEPFTFPLQESRFPLAPLHLLETDLATAEARLAAIEQDLQTQALQKARLITRRKELIEQLDVHLSGQSGTRVAADTLTVITAFVPVDKKALLPPFLDTQQIVYLEDAATIDDNPPIKLKNNRFARLFEPVGDMFMPPKYDELDVTKFFSPFYMLFFGFCMGDIGYGLVIFLIATVAKFAMPAKMKSLLSLGQLLGLAAMVMPVFSGTMFGLKIGDLFPATAQYFFDDLKMFYLAVAFGGLQIIFAKLVQAFDQMKRNGFQHGLSSLGWALLLIAAALTIVRSTLQLPLPAVLINSTLYAGAGLVLFFSSLSRNLFMRVGKGITAAYDITGIFGDLLSYIRLFGLATAGGILGSVVNEIGGMMWNAPYVGWLIGGLVFLIGHIAVMALSALSAAVHPMRLTFVEFYKNVGFTGGGRVYKPLKKTDKME